MALHASEILQPLQLLNKEVEFGKKIERNPWNSLLREIILPSFLSVI